MDYKVLFLLVIFYFIFDLMLLIYSLIVLVIN